MTANPRGESFTETTVCENDSLEMIGLCHVGMYAKNPASLAEFYRDVMGMEIVDRITSPQFDL